MFASARWLPLLLRSNAVESMLLRDHVVGDHARFALSSPGYAGIAAVANRARQVAQRCNEVEFVGICLVSQTLLHIVI